MPGTFTPAMGLAQQIDEHRVRNDDWSAVELFELTGALDIRDWRFTAFRSALVSHETVPDVHCLRRRASAIDTALSDGPLTVTETEDQDGYWRFELRMRHGHHAPPR